MAKGIFAALEPGAQPKGPKKQLTGLKGKRGLKSRRQKLMGVLSEEPSKPVPMERPKKKGSQDNPALAGRAAMLAMALNKPRKSAPLLGATVAGDGSGSKQHDYGSGSDSDWITDDDADEASPARGRGLGGSSQVCTCSVST